MFFVRKNFILHRKKNTSTVNEINNRQMIFHSDLLHAEIFFASNRKPGPGFYSLIIRKDNTLPAAYITYTGNCAACRATTLFFIHFVTGKSADLDKRFVLIR